MWRVREIRAQRKDTRRRIADRRHENRQGFGSPDWEGQLLGTLDVDVDVDGLDAKRGDRPRLHQPRTGDAAADLAKIKALYSADIARSPEKF